ncbi:MAG: hypothetical protein ABIQ39_13820 [Ilumatobacteraceae bacterium]
MTAGAYYAGLRPSEVVMLRVRSTELPTNGWGRLDVTEADISFDESGEPKTGPRSVPIPPVLVAILREWIDTNHLTSPERLLSVPATTPDRPDRIETLVSTYIGALDDKEHIANQRIDTYLGVSVGP